MIDDPLLSRIQKNLVEQHQCHTIILYGSRARGHQNEMSDYDIVALRDQGEMERDCRLMDGFYLDVFIYPENIIDHLEHDFIRLKDGIVLCQKENLGDRLLQKVHAMVTTEPLPMPAWEKQQINQWITKMLQRAAQEDMEGDFRRHWLLHDLLECYFKLRNRWYLGSRESFEWLKQHDHATYIAFAVALKKEATHESLERLVKRVLSS